MNSFPHEILDFFRQPGGQSLLVKGDAGTGKTIFSLELLNHFGKERTGFYLSTRVMPEKLYTQYPWIKEIIRPEHILDTSRIHRGHIEMFDLRLADVPSFLGEIHTKAKEVEKPFIVVDSWDGVAEKLSKEIRLKAEKILIGLVDINEGSKIVIVTEETEQTTLDYLVDGIVTLHKREIDGRLMREIELNKLRGVGTKHPKCLFTLNKGRFQSFAPFVTKPIPVKKTFQPVEDLDENTFSTGNRDLDNIFGGYPKGSAVLLEIMNDVSETISSLFGIATCFNFETQKRGFCMVPKGWKDAEVIKRLILPYLTSEEIFNRYTRIFQAKVPDKDQNVPYIVPVNGENLEEDFPIWLKTMAELKKISRGGHIVQFIANETMETYYELDQLREYIGRDVTETKRNNGLILFFCREGLESLQTTINASTIHLKMQVIDGVCTFYGRKPVTNLFAVEMDVSNGYPDVKITPIL